jgi:O-antigen/teichoic acid export membrane protein
MTTKVVKGSIWTLGGSVLPLAVSFISTPFIIRFLGAESYGVLLLVGLIPTYFSFADFGMGIASTKFASEAFGQGDRERESQVVWTAAAVAAVSAMVVTLPIFLLSRSIVTALNVPEHLVAQASTALKITSVAFAFGIVASVINSPMLARLRMDLNMATQAGPKILLAAVTPVILFLGGGIIGAVSWAFVVSVAALAVVFYFGVRLLPELARPALNRDLLNPLIRYGGAWLIASVAAMLLANIEKLFLPGLVSIRALAYYSVAFTFANMGTLFAQAMIQSLVPAFSQLLQPDHRQQFDTLFARGVRLNLIWLLPSLMVLFVIGRPFLTLWAGEEFGNESSLPLYILLIGMLFNVSSFISYSAILAAGRTEVFAKLYWIELFAYAGVAVFLISRFGIAGAAIAYSLRAFFDSMIIIYFSKLATGADFRFYDYAKFLLIGSALLVPPIVFTLLSGGDSLWIIPISVGSICLYALVVWKRLLSKEEVLWALEFLKRRRI